MIKQVIVIRKDLNMRKGKMVAQGAHASMAAILDEMTRMSDSMYLWYESQFDLESPIAKWLEGSFTKICVSVDSEKELLDVYDTANDRGLICSLIKDLGKTEFNNVPTYTAVAVGPAESVDIDKITGKLKLL